MATFVMIHGAWHGGWCFEPLRPFLERKGHRLIAPTLPGMDPGSSDAHQMTLAQWGSFVADLVLRQSEPVILCGHSRGGIVISTAAQEVPEAVRSLVYICAFLLPDGESLRAFQARAPNPEFSAAIRPAQDGATVSFDPSASLRLFYNRTPARIARAAADRLVPEPTQPLVTRLQLTTDRFGSVPRHYLECRDDRALTLSRQREMQVVLPCDSVRTLDSDHSPFLSCPMVLAENLDRLAR